MSFLCWGIYILADAFANPIDAGAAAVICAACIIAVGAILLFYLIKPRMSTSVTAHHRTVDSASARSSFLRSNHAPRHTDLRNNFAYQRFYSDHSRIQQ